MEYPKDPTVLPSAQRHTETYNADQGRVFTDGDVISIQIPPTSNSYLTKDVQLHFDFDMTYQEGTDENYKEIVGNLTFDNNKINIGLTQGTLAFSGGVAGNWSILETDYDSYDDVCQMFNSSNPSCPVHLYYDDAVSNKILALYGLLVQKGINDKLEYTENGITQEIITIEPEVYANGDTFPNYAVYTIANYINFKLGNPSVWGLRLTYDTTYNRYAFSGPDPFTIKKSSNEFMKSLGFSDRPTQDHVAYSVSGSYYTLEAQNPPPTSTTAIIEMQSTALATILNFTPNDFTKVNNNMDQYLVSSSHVFPTPDPENTPDKFFSNLIYKTTDSATSPNQTFPNLYRPYPTLDVNGPYGFFGSIEVYDYLGNTLLEKVPRHDLLTAIWSDLQSSSEDENTIFRPEILSDDLLSITKPSASYLIPGNENLLFSKSPITDVNPITEETVTAATLTLPTVSFGINLYSFLGKLSEKFVPLHNGFTVKFFINRRENAIAFNTQQPGNIISYNGKTNPPVDNMSFYTVMNPSINTYTFSNVYLRGDIITVPPELDSRIDKIVFAKGYKIQSGIAQNRAQRVNTDVKSLTSLVVVQQPGYSSLNSGSMRQSAFIRNYCPGAKLLYNKAVVSSVKNFNEAYRNFRNVFGCVWDKYIGRSNWEVDEPSSHAAWMQIRMIDKSNLSGLKDSQIDAFFQDEPVPLGYLPRYLLAFDTRLPGYTPMAVCGIDTRKQLLEVQLETTTNTKQSAIVTMISEYDTFIEIKPSESSAVSF